ncbi:ubiquinol-cytochrome C chaperone family protein [Taklimakanibacter lacteus]|uniref:ubiquinol-cytochrome C chaperone family protein n=1 Tax=Taklimakanibacter lacteus TaxID=2268456 RepID=UPI000E6635A7
MILSLFKRKASRISLRAVYGAIVAAARHPRFYAEWGVPDTVDGRYDMIILHAVLVLDRLASDGEAGRSFSQGLTDEVFADMDRSLREMGVGDLSVGKKVRRMAEVFYGRAQAYTPLLRADDTPTLAQAIYRNIYAGEGPEAGAGRIAAYALEVRRYLQERPTAPILAGQIGFPDPSK